MEKVREALLKLSGEREIAAFDIKKQYAFLKQDTTERYFDILIGAYLLNPLKNDYDIESIASEHLGLVIPGRTECLGKAGFAEAAQQMPES